MSIDKAQKRKELIDRVSGKSGEPILTEDNYDLTEVLNWHSKHTDSKTRKSWVVKYYKKQKHVTLAEHFDTLPDFDFHAIGILIRSVELGGTLQESEQLFLNNKIKELTSKQTNKTKTKVTSPTVVVSIQDRILEKAREIGGEIEGEIDEFVLSGCPKDFKFKTPIKTFNPHILKHITSFIKPRIVELQDAYDGKDEQLVEGYSNFKRTELKRFIALLENLIIDCEEQKVAAKAVRKPRARKAKPAAVQVAKMKFMKDFPELKLKSINPAEIIGADEVWVYNTKYRRITVYRSADSNGLGVKGTTIINYTIKNSGTKTLRKPEDFLPKVLTTPKRSLAPEYRIIKAKEAQPNGRINEETIIVRAFK
jgi:hypothetical protein